MVVWLRDDIQQGFQIANAWCWRRLLNAANARLEILPACICQRRRHDLRHLQIEAESILLPYQKRWSLDVLGICMFFKAVPTSKVWITDATPCLKELTRQR